MPSIKILPALLLGMLTGLSYAQESRWEKAIKTFEEADAASAPPQGAILFLGSSSIRMWDDEKYFPKLKTINRGFGGSQISDSIEFANRIALPYKPKIIAFYAGDNDLAAGKSPEKVCTDYIALVEKIHATLPKTRIVFVAIKPSLARWGLVEKVRAANSLIQKVSKEDKRLDYLDIDAPMLGDDGKPRAELFISDGLHLSAEGYELWSKLLRPYIQDNGK